MRRTRARDPLERRVLRNLERRCFERLKKRLRALVSRAAWMKPERHLALAEQIGQSLPEAQLASGQPPTRRRGIWSVRSLPVQRG